MTSSEEIMPDDGLVASIALPAEALVPDPETGAATQVEYDRYFGISREQVGLLPWTRTCLGVTDSLLPDLHSSRLSSEDQRDLLRGLVLVLQTTLSRWADAASSFEHNQDGGSNNGG